MKLGVLGGTFDPIHNGHVAAAAAAAAGALGLDTITLIPSHIPPHRHDPVGATSEQRYEMAQAGGRGPSGWSASRIELDREGPSYTYDTLVAWRSCLSERSASKRRAARVEGYADLLHHRRRCVRRNCDMVALPGRAGPREFRGRLAARNHVRLITCSRPVGISRSSISVNTRDSGRSAHSRHFIDRHPAARPRRPQPLRFRSGSRRPLHRGASSLLWTLDCMAKDH